MSNHARIGKTTPEADPAKTKLFRQDIQGLRAVAILVVILYHSHVPRVTGGYIGVDVFFVISGFLITGHLVKEVERTGSVSLLGFYARRARRLLPSASIVVIVTLLATRLLETGLGMRSLSLDALFTAFFGLNYRLAAQGINYQEIANAASPLQHFWSLAVEEQFYFAWPIIVVAAMKLFAKRTIVLLPILVVIFASSLAFSIHVTQTNAPLSYFSIHTRAWELAAGAIVAILATQSARLPRIVASALAAIGLGAIVVSVFAFDDKTPFPGSAALVPVLGAAALIAAGCGQKFLLTDRLLHKRPLQGIGRVSYGWYLWHWPLIILGPKVAGYEFSWIRNLEMCALGLWLAVLMFLLVESPTLRSRMRHTGWLTTGALTSATTAATAALMLFTLPPLVGTGTAATLKSSTSAADSQYLASVAKLIEDSQTSQSVPVNLSPSIGTASKDEPVTTHSGCNAPFLAVDQPECVFGDPDGSQTMVLVGDSHADQWQPAFDEAGKRLHWRVVSWTKSACPFADVIINNPQLNRRYTECEQWRTQTLDKITAMRPDLVVMSQSDSVIGKAYSDSQWADATASRVRDLSKSGAKVVYMLDTPYPATDTPVCLSNHIKTAQECSRSRYEGNWLRTRHDLVAKRVRDAGVEPVEPGNWFCSTTRCPPIVGNLLVYRDASHMSKTYSEWLTPMVQPLLTTK